MHLLMVGGLSSNACTAGIYKLDNVNYNWEAIGHTPSQIYSYHMDVSNGYCHRNVVGECKMSTVILITFRDI